MEVQFAPQADAVQNGETALTQRRRGMFGISEPAKPVIPSMKMAPGLGFEKWWLPKKTVFQPVLRAYFDALAGFRATTFRK